MRFAVAVSWLLLGAHPDARFRAGVFLYDAGKYDGAVRLYREILADHPHDAPAVYELALSLVASRKNDEAVALIDAELKSSVAQSPRLYAVLARAYDAKAEPERARAALERGLVAEPESGELHYDLGVHFASREQWPKAIAEFSACARFEPENPSGWWGLGRAYEATRDAPRAAGAYARAALTRAEPMRVKAAAERVRRLTAGPDALARMLGGDEADTYYSAARAAGHLDALAHDLYRLGGDAAAELWCAEHAAELDAWRAWHVARAAAK